MGVLAVNLHRMINPSQSAPSFLTTMLDRIYSAKGLVTATLLVGPWLLWLVGEGVWTRLTQGVVVIHWSRVVLAGVVVFALAQLTLSILLANIMRFHAQRARTQLMSGPLHARSAPKPFVHASPSPKPSPQAGDSVYAA